MPDPEDIEIIQFTEIDPLTKRPRLSLSPDSNKSIASTSFHSEPLETSNIIENKKKNIDITNIVLKVCDVINFDIRNLLNTL